MLETADAIDGFEAIADREHDETPFADQFAQAMRGCVFSPDDCWEVKECVHEDRPSARLIFNGVEYCLVADEMNSIRDAARTWYERVVRRNPARAR